jgi:hypothetical protein
MGLTRALTFSIPCFTFRLYKSEEFPTFSIILLHIKSKLSLKTLGVQTQETIDFCSSVLAILISSFYVFVLYFVFGFLSNTIFLCTILK